MTDYTGLERLLHRLALGNSATAEMAFSTDQTLSKPDPDVVRRGPHVFVAGLARAGTTILTRRLYESGAFRSLTYRDMPFVLAPGLWRKIRGKSRQSVQAAERAHGDGLIVDIDSPEALEEPFWRLFDGPAYILADRMIPHTPDSDMIDRYRAYVGAILISTGSSRYLAKNNNNILRLPTLAKAFPNALILIPFRDPLTHAASLENQHRRFCILHGEDPFARQYMGWLAHHEFGADHKFFAVPGDTTPTIADSEYWLGQWYAVDDWLASTAPENARFVCYEDLCNDPSVWTGLAKATGISGTLAKPFRPVPSVQRSAGSELFGKSAALYYRLRDLSRGERVCPAA